MGDKTPCMEIPDGWEFVRDVRLGGEHNVKGEYILTVDGPRIRRRMLAGFIVVRPVVKDCLTTETEVRMAEAPHA